MGRKTVRTRETELARKRILAKSTNTELRGLAQSFADVKAEGETTSIGVVFAKHVEMVEKHIPELEEIFRTKIRVDHMAMLEAALSLEARCRFME